MTTKKHHKKNSGIVQSIIIVFLIPILVGSAAFAYKYITEDKHLQANAFIDTKEISSKKEDTNNINNNKEVQLSSVKPVQKDDNQISQEKPLKKDFEASEKNTTATDSTGNVPSQSNDLVNSYGISNFIFKLVDRPERGKLFGHPIPFHKKVFGYNSAAGKVVALTFDDGPVPEYTERYVDILKSMDVKATFFVIGKNAERHPELLKYIVENGNEIGLHSYSHFNMKKMKPEQMVDELYKTQKILVEATGIKPTLFRPPYGAFNRTLLEISDALGLNVTLWNVDPDDWRSPAVESVVNRVISHTKNGSVILMHEGKINTLAALPQIIEKLKAEGYSFVTVSELLNYEKDHVVSNTEQQNIEINKRD
ncbi:MAG TPA: polysaccharide deacetylase family protein [Clostridia bacterium]|nr:polysaccharide deacetylase family protein [Clostridia bacterium]